jgi:hypothetical protein
MTGPVKHDQRQQMVDWWIVVTDVAGKKFDASMSVCPPGDCNVMRTHRCDRKPDVQTQSWDRATGQLVDDAEKLEACAGRAVMVKLSDLTRGPVYGRKEVEARAVLAGDATIAPHVLTAEAAARGMSVEQLAALVLQRAEQDCEALAKAWGCQEAERVRSKGSSNAR